MNDEFGSAAAVHYCRTRVLISHPLVRRVAFAYYSDVFLDALCDTRNALFINERLLGRPTSFNVQLTCQLLCDLKIRSDSGFFFLPRTAMKYIPLVPS